MKTWLIGGAVVVLAGAGVYLTTAHRTRPTEPLLPDPDPVAVKLPPPEPAPVVLAKVVDVTDIDPLLDPPAISALEATTPTGPTLTAVGLDDPAPKSTSPPPAATPIPAAD